MEDLLKGGKCSAWTLFEIPRRRTVFVKSDDLAKTSRYRAYRLVLAIKQVVRSIGTRGTSILKLS